jgi:enoyl-CoA hydratase/carnithine racemase
MINRVLAADELIDAALEWAHTIAERCSPSSFAITKVQFVNALTQGLWSNLSDASRAAVQAFSDDGEVQDGVASDQEGRRPGVKPLDGGTGMLVGMSIDGA